MNVNIFIQNFDGYWRESNKNRIPSKSGIYCVYESTYNEQKRTVTIHKLIYIGESENVNERITHHEKQKEWEEHISKGNELCYSFSAVENYYLVRVAAAFIYSHQPLLNSEYIDKFPLKKTIVKSEGLNILLKHDFIVNPT